MVDDLAHRPPVVPVRRVELRVVEPRHGRPHSLRVCGDRVDRGGYFGYAKLQNARYGLNPAVPLGTFEKLDTYLADDIGLIKSEASSLPVRDIRTTPRMFRYTNRENEYESVTLLLDGGGTLRGIVGVYWLGDFGSRSP